MATSRLAGFADGLADVSLLVSHGFDKRGGQLGQAFRSSERTARIIYSQLGLLGDTVRTGNKLLPLYGELTSLKGTGGKNYMRTQGPAADRPLRADPRALRALPHRRARAGGR